MISKKSVLAIVAALAALGATFGAAHALLAGGEAPPAAALRDQAPGDAFPAALRANAEARGFKIDTSRQIAPTTYLVERDDGQLCLVQTARGMTAGCNPKASFFHGESVKFGIAEQGGPDAPTSVRIAGIARPDITLVRVHFGSVVVDATPSKDGGFVIEGTAQALAAGRLSTLDTYRANGTLVKTYDLPQS